MIFGFSTSIFLFALITHLSTSFESARFLDDHIELLDLLLDRLPDELDNEEEVEVVNSMRYVIEQAKTRTQIERAETPLDVIENSFVYFKRTMFDKNNADVLLPGKLTAIEATLNNRRTLRALSRALTMTMQTAKDWKVAKTRDYYKKHLRKDQFERDDDIDEVLENDLVMMIDFFDLTLPELNIYDNEDAAREASIRLQEEEAERERREEQEEEEAEYEEDEYETEDLTLEDKTGKDLRSINRFLNHIGEL